MGPKENEDTFQEHVLTLWADPQDEEAGEDEEDDDREEDEESDE